MDSAADSLLDAEQAAALASLVANLVAGGDEEQGAFTGETQLNLDILEKVMEIRK